MMLKALHKVGIYLISKTAAKR